MGISESSGLLRDRMPYRHRCLLWVISGHFRMSERCPPYPKSGHPWLGVIVYRLHKGNTQQVAVRFQGTLQSEIAMDVLVNELLVLNRHLGY